MWLDILPKSYKCEILTVDIISNSSIPRGIEGGIDNPEFDCE
jgi:hypothetical protein